MSVRIVLAGILWLVPATAVEAQAPAPAPVEPLVGPAADIVAHLDRIESELVACNQDIFEFAEVGLQEFRSAARLMAMLEKAGFRIKQNVADMPTAFVAEYGSGAPVIGMLAEYDALPELSQQAVPERRPAPGRTTGHGCGHCAFGTAVIGAALAVKAIYQKHNLKGTLRVYGTPAEETLIGKVYMALDGQFKDLDACLHWHPSDKNRISFQGSKALISAKFTFSGLAAHASGSPHKGRSALDGVELMNIGVNYLREHVKESSRLHYVVTNGGGQPNVVPPTAQVWYFVRGNTHVDAEYVFDWVVEIAEAAAKMSRTKVSTEVVTDCHEIIPNRPLSRAIERNFRRVGPPRFTPADLEFARKLQEPLRADPGFQEKLPLNDSIEPLRDEPYPADGGSTDVGDVSWFVPTGGFGAVCFAAGSPGHSWQNVAAVGSPIGHKGMMTAAKVLALTSLDLLTDARLRADSKADFAKRMEGLKYTTRIPPGQKAPRSIR